jgi:hypothetical protein
MQRAGSRRQVRMNAAPRLGTAGGCSRWVAGRSESFPTPLRGSPPWPGVPIPPHFPPSGQSCAARDRADKPHRVSEEAYPAATAVRRSGEAPSAARNQYPWSAHRHGDLAQLVDGRIAIAISAWAEGIDDQPVLVLQLMRTFQLLPVEATGLHDRGWILAIAAAKRRTTTDYSG